MLNINYLLEILNNDLNIDEKNFLRLILTIQALGEEIPEKMWEIFLNKQLIDAKEVYFKRDDTNNYFLLDRAVEKNNLAEAALISIILLQSEKGLHKESYSFYKGIKG